MLKILVMIAVRYHLFPYRTQKLSSLAPKVLGWKRPGRLGSREVFLLIFFLIGYIIYTNLMVVKGKN